ncbi:hypothetical protein [Methanospirillum lacunae]|nr:hypothetical protein [Methanospirillum lacunae]
MNTMIPNHSHDTLQNERYPVNPFDLSTDLFCTFSNQIIHMVIHLDGQVRFDLLEKAVEMASLAEPITRCRIIRDQNTLFWQECSDFYVPDHILLLSSRTPLKLLFQALSYPLDPYLGKLFQIILLENSAKTGDIVVINVHHIVMDARGLKDFVELIIRCYNDYQSGFLTEIPITPIQSHQLPRVTTFITEKNPIETPKPPIGWSSPISVPLQSLHAEKYRYSIMMFHPDRTEIIQKTRRKWGITVNDFMIAVLVRAIASVLNEKLKVTIPLYTTIDLRRYLQIIPRRSLVNVSTSFEIRIPLNPVESIEDTGKRIHVLMNEIKSRRSGLYEMVESEILFDSGYTAAQKLINSVWNNIKEGKSKTTIFSNTGIINREQVNPGELSVRNAYILPSFFQPPGFFFLLSTFEDIMTLSASYAISAYDPDLVNRMFHYIDRDIPGFTKFPGEYKIIE